MIRPATAADAAAIAAFWNPVIRDTLITFNSEQKSPADIARLIAERPAFVVADEGQGPVGFATYTQFRGGDGYRRTLEHTIILGPGARGRGLGRGLMAEIEAHARAGGGHTIYAGVSAANPGGRAFHAAIGYVELAVLPEAGFKFGRWIDLVLMRKILS